MFACQAVRVTGTPAPPPPPRHGGQQPKYLLWDGFQSGGWEWDHGTQWARGGSKVNILTSSQSEWGMLSDHFITDISHQPVRPPQPSHPPPGLSVRNIPELCQPARSCFICDKFSLFWLSWDWALNKVLKYFFSRETSPSRPQGPPPPVSPPPQPAVSSQNCWGNLSLNFSIVGLAR